MSSTNNDSKRPAHELRALLRNADDITRSAATITTECRRFMAHLQKVLAGPDAQVLRQEMGEALARLLGAFDGYAAAVAKHSVAFAVAVDDAAGWVEAVKASCAAAVGGSDGSGDICGSREGEDARLSPQSSSSSASGRTVVRTTRPMRTFSVDSSNAFGSSSSSFSPAKSPGSRAPVPPIHTTPPFRSPLAVQPASPPFPSRTVTPDPHPQPPLQAPLFSADDSVSALREAFSQAGVSDTQTRRSPPLSLSPSPPKSAFTFRAPSPPAAVSQCGSATISRSSSTTARTPSPAGATYSLSSSSSASTSRTCSPFSPSSPSPSSTTSASPSSSTTPSLHTAERAYTVVARGVNVHGNRWERRAYGPGSPDCTSFHYSNADGSNYSSLPDGSERFEMSQL
ncbi:uncharacterized protein J3D65DRAFT_674946 [Phyllosticta citribraziliensis]|uniref:Uncharacterized protein n=1 Tax=Phyllosticta citribraziliensis TaxID=989973 RepID=A0ABR1M1K0_9PEZI